jgi:AcrR family transcriptional regulator
MTTTNAPSQVDERQRDATRTRSEILKVATQEFADRGYNGARVDEIAARTRTTKRMIYYYFGGKRQLYVAVLEQAYAQVRSAERELNVDHLDPVAAIKRLAEVSFDHHEAHVDFIRLVMNENIHRGENIAQLTSLVDLNSPAIELISRILERGRHQGLFRDDVDAIDVHMMISAYCFFRVGNRHTFGAIFGRDMLDPKRRNHYKQILGDMVAGHLTSPAVR